MKKLLPYLFPLIALVVVVALIYRWYAARTQRTGDISSFGEGVQIENLTDADQQNLLRAAGDFQKATLAPESGIEATGQIRYEIEEGKVKFSIMADLPVIKDGTYQVWLRKTDSGDLVKAFTLSEGKGGMMGSGSITEGSLPFEVVVSQEAQNDESLEKVLLKGTVTK